MENAETAEIVEDAAEGPAPAPTAEGPVPAPAPAPAPATTLQEQGKVLC